MYKHFNVAQAVVRRNQKFGPSYNCRSQTWLLFIFCYRYKL